MSEPSTLDDFKPFVGRIFSFHQTPHAFPLDRIETEGFGGDHSEFRTPFILIFRGPKPGAVLPEGLYGCDIEDGPGCTLYVAAIHTPEPDRQEYQAVFN